MHVLETLTAGWKPAIAALGCLLLAGCYEYTKPPIAEASMKPIRETALGEKFLALAEKMDKDENVSKAKKGMDKDTLVLELTKDMFLLQEKKEKGENWEVKIVMSTSDHMMFCQYLASEKSKVIEGLEVLKKKDGPSTLFVVSGDQAKMQEHVVHLVKKSLKLCMAVPYAAMEG